MSIGITWRNIFFMVGLASALFSALVAGTGVVIQWRMDAVQNQLTDRMTMFQREVEHIEQRIDKLEKR